MFHLIRTGTKNWPHTGMGVEITNDRISQVCETHKLGFHLTGTFYWSYSRLDLFQEFCGNIFCTLESITVNEATASKLRVYQISATAWAIF